MTQNWEQIRPVVFYWMIAMACIAAYFAFWTVSCSTIGCADRTMSGGALLGLSAIFLSSLLAAYMLMKVNAQLLFSPLVAFAASTALFFGFGPMSNILAGEATLAYQAQTVYAIGAEETLRTGLLSSFGLAVTIATTAFFLPRYDRVLPKVPTISIETVAMLFVVSGLVLKHLIIMPTIYGTSNFQIPGILQNLRYLPDLGFALVAMLGAAGNRKWVIFFWLIWPIHFLLAFPEFSKKSVMLTMILPAIGAYIGHRSIGRLMLWVIPAVMIFTYLQNANAIARWEENRLELEERALGTTERLVILGDAISNDQDVQGYLPISKQGVETWWLRLNYSGPQSAAMRLHDAGYESSMTESLLVYFVPRFLWPDKPFVDSPGQEFHQVVTQNANTTTRVGITVFADGYLKMGWFGVVLFSVIIGLIFAVITRMTMNQLSQRRALYLPAAMLGIQMAASSTTSFLQNGFFAGLPVYFGYCIVVALFYSTIGNRENSAFRQPIIHPARSSVGAG